MEIIILLTKITAIQNEVTLRYHRVRGLYFLAVIFAATILKIKHYMIYIIVLSIICIGVSGVWCRNNTVVNI